MSNLWCQQNKIKYNINDCIYIFLNIIFTFDYLMAEAFCRVYVDNVFSKWDKDQSNVLSRQELKYWLKD